MGTFQKFEEINAWQKARTLANEIYMLTGCGTFSKDYALIDQMRRSCISVISNIAEGYERDGKKEFAHFLFIAKGSCGELKAQPQIAFDQKYIDVENFHKLYNLANETGRMIGCLIGYLKRTSVKGSKVK